MNAMKKPSRLDSMAAVLCAACQDPRVTEEIISAAIGVIEAVTDHTFNPGPDLIEVYDKGRALGAILPGGVDATASPNEGGQHVRRYR